MNNKAFKVGIVSFILAAAITVLLVWKSGILLKASGTELYGSFGTINGLLNGAEVRYRGYKIGQVFEIKPEPKEVLVKFNVKEGVNIPKGSRLTVVFDGLVGEKYLGIEPNYESTVMVTDGEILYGKASLGLASFVDIGAKNLQTSKEILDTFNKILSEKEVSDSIKNGLLQIEEIALRLNKITEDISSISEEQAISNMLTNFKEISHHLNLASERMFVEHDMASDLAKIASNLESMTEKMDRQILDQENIQNLNNTIRNISMLTDQLNGLFSNGENTPSTGNKTSSVISRASSMVSTLSAIRVRGESKVEYSTVDKVSYFDIAMDVKFKQSFFRLGLGNRLGATQFFNVQHGVNLNQAFVARYGLFFTHPGVGLDYQLADPISFSLDVYDPNNLQVEVYSRLRLLEKLGLLVGVRPNATEDKFNNYTFGLSYSM